MDYKHDTDQDIVVRPAPNYNVAVVKSRADVIRDLTARIPTNDLGLPHYIYRTDMIPSNLDDDDMDPEERVQILQMASFQLDYTEGYPTQPDGNPFWSQLPFEPMSAFTVFNLYLGEYGKDDGTGIISVQMRTFEHISKISGLSPAQLREMSYLYFWSARAKAQDQFTVACFHKQRERRALVLEDEHYRKSAKIMQALEKQAEKIFGDEDFFDEMKPKDVLDALEKFMKMQRLAVGLSTSGGSGDSSKDGSPKNASLQVVLRSIAEKAGERAQVMDETGDTLGQLLNDEAALTILQDLIIKAGARK